MSAEEKATNNKPESECNCGEPKRSVTFEEAGMFVAKFVGELDLPKGASTPLTEPMFEAVKAAKNSDFPKTKENLDNFIKNVEKSEKIINTSKKFPSGAFGYDNPSVMLNQLGNSLIECLPTVISSPIGAQVVLLAASSSCLDDCLETLAKCLGISSGALLLCGAGCLPALLLGPGGYGSCVAVCAGLSGGVLAGVCFSNFIDCVGNC